VEEFFCLYIDALDDELLAIFTSNSSDSKSTSATHEVEEREVAQSRPSDNIVLVAITCYLPS
jgi:hypothetical protein